MKTFTQTHRLIFVVLILINFNLQAQYYNDFEKFNETPNCWKLQSCQVSDNWHIGKKGYSVVGFSDQNSNLNATIESEYFTSALGSTIVLNFDCQAALNISSKPNVNVWVEYDNGLKTKLLDYDFVDKNVQNLTFSTVAKAIKFRLKFNLNAEKGQSAIAIDNIMLISDGLKNITLLNKPNEGCYESMPIAVNQYNFNAKNENDVITLNLTLPYGSDAKVYEIQKSINGQDFRSIASIKGSHKIEKQTLSFVDKNPYFGQNYYRLKEVKTDDNIKENNIAALSYVLSLNSMNEEMAIKAKKQMQKTVADKSIDTY